MPCTIGEDYSGPVCTGELVEPTPRKDLHCEMPATVGEDFAGEVCTQTSSPVLITDTAQIELERRHNMSDEPSQLVANEVKIQLDLQLAEINSKATDRSDNVSGFDDDGTVRRPGSCRQTIGRRVSQSATT